MADKPAADEPAFDETYRGDVVYDRHYRATKDLKIKLVNARREHVDGHDLQAPFARRGDEFNQAPGTVLEVAEGHVVRLSEAEAEKYLKSGDLTLVS